MKLLTDMFARNEVYSNMYYIWWKFTTIRRFENIGDQYVIHLHKIYLQLVGKGLEPMTAALLARCSADWANRPPMLIVNFDCDNNVIGISKMYKHMKYMSFRPKQNKILHGNNLPLLEYTWILYWIQVTNLSSKNFQHSIKLSLSRLVVGKLLELIKRHTY